MGRRTTAEIDRLLLPLILAGLLTAAVLVVVPTPEPSSAQGAQAQVDCPMMTDSINRLYLAYYNRPPDGTEFSSATTRYRSGEAGLEVLSEELAGSTEFRTRYGDVDDDRFVDLVYRNVLRRDPGPSDRDFWITSLGSSYPRGSMMLAFSESEEFVQRTDTDVPLSGFLRWYPEGVHWYCGTGPRATLGIRPLNEASLYADFIFANRGSGQSVVGLQTLLNGAINVTMAQGSLPAGFSEYKWDGLFGGDGDYGSALRIDAGQNMSWIVVFYPRSIGVERLGWRLES